MLCLAEDLNLIGLVIIEGDADDDPRDPNRIINLDFHYNEIKMEIFVHDLQVR